VPTSPGYLGGVYWADVAALSIRRAAGASGGLGRLFTFRFIPLRARQDATRLYYAARTGDLKTIKDLARTASFVRTLHAFSTHPRACLTRLYALTANVEAKWVLHHGWERTQSAQNNKYLQPAFEIAVQHNQLPAVHLFLTYGAILDATTPLYCDLRLWQLLKRTPFFYLHIKMAPGASFRTVRSRWFAEDRVSAIRRAHRSAASNGATGRPPLPFVNLGEPIRPGDVRWRRCATSWRGGEMANLTRYIPHGNTLGWRATVGVGGAAARVRHRPER